LLQVKVHGLVVASAADASRQIDMCTVSLAHPSVQHALSRTVGGGNQDAAIVEYTISVTNTGLVDADDVVLGFLTPPRAGIGGVPLQSLFGFERVHLRSGKAECTHGPSRRHRFNQRCCVRFGCAGATLAVTIGAAASEFSQVSLATKDRASPSV
jgi:hypothetical protein